MTILQAVSGLNVYDSSQKQDDRKIPEAGRSREKADISASDNGDKVEQKFWITIDHYPNNPNYPNGFTTFHLQKTIENLIGVDELGNSTALKIFTKYPNKPKEFIEVKPSVTVATPYTCFAQGVLIYGPNNSFVTGLGGTIDPDYADVDQMWDMGSHFPGWTSQRIYEEKVAGVKYENNEVSVTVQYRERNNLNSPEILSGEKWINDTDNPWGPWKTYTIESRHNQDSAGKQSLEVIKIKDGVETVLYSGKGK